MKRNINTENEKRATFSPKNDRHIMKKIFLSIAILALSITSFAATSSSDANGNTPTTEQQTTPGKKNKAAKADRKKDGSDRKKDMEQRRQDRENRLFAGITLTDAQKAKLQELKEKNKPNRDAKKPDDKKMGDRKDKEKLSAEQRQQKMAERDAKHRAYLAGIKEILTPEQYITVLENSFTMNQKGPKMHKQGHNKHGKKHMSSRDKDKKNTHKKS